MYPPDPLLTVRTAVTPQTFKDPKERIDLNQAIPVGKALKAITIDAAHALNKEQIVGSLETNKRADIVVLDDDPCRRKKVDIHAINVRALFIGGSLVYTKGPDSSENVTP